MTKAPEAMPFRSIYNDPELFTIAKAAYPPVDNLKRPDQLQWALNRWMEQHPGGKLLEGGPIVVKILEDEEVEHDFLCACGREVVRYSRNILTTISAIRARRPSLEKDVVFEAEFAGRHA